MEKLGYSRRWTHGIIKIKKAEKHLKWGAGVNVLKKK